MIDSHQHYWQYSPEDYEWIDDSMAVIRRDFTPADLRETAGSLGVTGSVAVQARQSVAESQWLLDLAGETSFIKGVVGWVPLADATVAACLDQLATDDKFKGVRHVVQGEFDPEFLAGAAFNAGIREVTALDLVYDLLVTTPQLGATIRFVDRHPQQRFVLDHIANPVVAGAPPVGWREHISELAERPNVCCKFSGVVTEVPAETWSVEQVKPYWEVVLAAFGPQRLMFGSDWPVCLVRSSYARWFECVHELASTLSPSEYERVMGGTARSEYRL
jgi:L-fuconolactonase